MSTGSLGIAVLGAFVHSETQLLLTENTQTIYAQLHFDIDVEDCSNQVARGSSNKRVQLNFYIKCL